MEKQAVPLTELQFRILDGMADDYEDVEQLYLYANRELEKEDIAGINFPEMLLKIRFPLREIVDEVASMLQEGYIEARYSNDVKLAPLHPVDFSLLHHYWFGPTQKGSQAWSTYKEDSSQV